jgi:LPXTG-motif cell wall-anchored protein
MIWPLFVTYGVYIALTEGISKALIANVVPSEVRGTAIGLFYMVTGLLAVIASVVAGYLWDHVSQSAPFFVGAGMALIAGVGFLVWKREKQGT